MPANPNRHKILKWARVMLTYEDDPVKELTSFKIKYLKILPEKIAQSLYKNLMIQEGSFNSPYYLNKKFSVLNQGERSVWIEYAADIPDKLSSLNLYIRPFREFCRTCIITDNEIEKLARKDHDNLYRRLLSEGWKKGATLDDKRKINPALLTFRNLPDNVKRFFMELNYLIPLVLKQAGFEIIRAEESAEINEKMVRKIARAIHSRYQQEVKRHGDSFTGKSVTTGFYNPGFTDHPDLSDFDHLPDEIKYSNIDNAYHIPTKLLAIGYKIRPTGKGYKPVALHLNAKEVETMAKVEHIRWSWDKRLNEWTYGKKRDNLARKHPGLVPYEKLKESEKEKDRELVSLIPSLLKDIGYEVFAVNPGRIKNLSYAIKPQSIIHRILDETRKMNDQIRKLVTLTPEIDEMVNLRNRKIEEAINEIEESYNYARHIQETFLPDNLYIRECFPDSFILYKPKDIVSGDFYFFSKRDHNIIFAAADCTGHGIPGALLSTLGYGILDQAVNEIKLTDPSEVLNHLYPKIHRFLRNDEQESGILDDMDIVLCVFDSENTKLAFAGLKNIFYRISKGVLSECRPRNIPAECNKEGNCNFLTETVHLSPGDIIYLFSDGFADQFGGSGHKKYQTGRFKSFLLSICNNPMAEQGDLLFEEIEKWREEKGEDQTDDIMVIGIKI